MHEMKWNVAGLEPPREASGGKDVDGRYLIAHCDDRLQHGRTDLDQLLDGDAEELRCRFLVSDGGVGGDGGCQRSALLRRGRSKGAAQC